MRFLKFFLVFAGFLTLYTSCKKDSNSVDFTPRFYFVNGGSSVAYKNLILFPSSDTVTFNIVVSSTYLLSKSTTVSLEVADEYRDTYNTTKGTSYKEMPSGAYSFATSFTAGTTYIYDTIPVTFRKSLLANDNYMLPIKIVSAGTYKIDSASSVIYLYTNSNELSGLYNSDGKRILYVGDADNNNISETVSFDTPKSIIPVSADTSLLDYADLASNGWKYILSYDAAGAGFTVTPNPVILASVEPGTFEVIDAEFDPSSKHMHIKTRYKNLSGDERIVEESLTLQ